MDNEQQNIEGFHNESASTIPQAIPTANAMNVFPPRNFLPTNEYEEMMAFLCDDNPNSQQDQARKKSKTIVTTPEEEDSLAQLFQLDQPVSLEEILGQQKTLSSRAQVGGSSSHVLRDVAPQSVITNTRSTLQLNSNSSERINLSISPGTKASNACTSTFGQGSSSGLVQRLGANKGVLNSIFSSENSSNSNLSLPENDPKFWPAGSNALYPPQAGASFGDSIFPKTTGNSLTRFESPSLPVHPYGSASASFGTGVSASASGVVGNSLTQFQSPSLAHPYAGPSVGSGAGLKNLDGNSLTQSPSFPVHSYVGPSAGPSRAPIVGSADGANNLDGNSVTQYQSLSFPVHPHGSASSGGIAGASASASTGASGFAAAANASPYGSHQQLVTRDHRFEMSGINPLAVPSAMGANTWASPVPTRSQYNQTQFSPRHPFLRDFKELVLAWEGCLVEKGHPNRIFFNQAKVWKKPTSAVTLTDWSSMLELALSVPRKAVINMMRLYGGPLDYIFFEVTQFGNLDLYNYLIREKMYAKVVLPSHTLILFTTDSKHCYLGSVFKGDAVFIENL